MMCPNTLDHATPTRHWLSFLKGSYSMWQYDHTINITKNPVQHSRTKHIEVKHRFNWDHVRKCKICSFTFVISWYFHQITWWRSAQFYSKWTWHVENRCMDWGRGSLKVQCDIVRKRQCHWTRHCDNISNSITNLCSWTFNLCQIYQLWQVAYGWGFKSIKFPNSYHISKTMVFQNLFKINFLVFF